MESLSRTLQTDSALVSDDDEDDEGPIHLDDIAEDIDDGGAAARNPTPPLPAEVELDVVEINSEVVRPGDVVELQAELHLADRDFLVVKNIIEILLTGEIRLRGYRLWRTSHLAPMFDREYKALNKTGSAYSD